VKMVMWLPACFLITREYPLCAHIHACAKLPSGEEILLAYLLFMKIHRNLR